ncbi:MAG TPA: porin family protein, partial [Cytophagales bacterium]|nr:porin family protein [Cytophagales bacterium]
YQDRQSIEASFVEVPILLKYKSQRRGNFRMYIVGGAKAGISTSNKNKDQRPDKLRLKSFDLAIDYGLGCDLYFPLFKFSPELRFSNGLIDMKAPDQNKYAKAVQNLRSKTITLVLNFE